MLVVYRNEGRWEDREFREFPGYLGPGDCLLVNDSKVFPSRLDGKRAGRTGAVEVFLVRPAPAAGTGCWEALVRPGRRMRVGDVVTFAPGLEAEIVARGEYGERTIRFRGPASDPAALLEALEHAGHMPLPPYIKRADDAADRERYQTVFAREPGSAAAPTAGLHFTADILDRCHGAGAEIAAVTLHVGLGTFQPLRREHLESGMLHPEAYTIAAGDFARVREAKRVVAAGTTSVRAIETACATGALAGDTRLFIRPGYRFAAVGALLTNFHLPQSSLLMLVCAFAGEALTLAAYRHAVETRYRFYSFGDCMLIV
jgi:S-adenosylmethionine:tRNA ribosyltransferase-isomerase